MRYGRWNNSTTLLESALLGKTVVSSGGGPATGSGLLVGRRPGDNKNMAQMRVDQQMLRNDVLSLIEVLRSPVFLEMPAMCRDEAITILAVTGCETRPCVVVASVLL